jgi:hypothetical protein
LRLEHRFDRGPSVDSPTKPSRRRNTLQQGSVTSLPSTGVVHVELRNQRISVAPHVEHLVSKARDGTEERIDRINESGHVFDHLCVPEAQRNVFSHERRQRRDIFRVEGGEDRAGEV